jgi:hypothetical protein
MNKKKDTLNKGCLVGGKAQRLLQGSPASYAKLGPNLVAERKPRLRGTTLSSLDGARRQMKRHP